MARSERSGSGKRIRRHWVAILAVLFALPANADYEAPVVLSATEDLPPALLVSEHHRVADAVANDGYMNSYRIESSYGVFEVQGTSLLRERVREIEALAALESTSRTKAVLTGLVRPARDTAGTLGAVGTSPWATATGLPGGVKRRFERYADQARSVADGVGGVAEEVREANTSGMWNKARGLASSEVGVDAAERRWHRKLGTDPYTTNPVLREAVTRVAKLDAGAGFAFDQLPIPEPDAMDYLEDAGDLVWSQSRGELRKINAARLAALGTPPEAIAAFLDHSWFSPTLQTVMILMLSRMEDVEGRGDWTAHVLDADSESVALFLTENVVLMAWYHEHREPLERILPATPAATALSDGGRVVAFASADHIRWSRAVAANVAKTEAIVPGAQLEIWLPGTLSERTRKELADRGVEPHEGIPLYQLRRQPDSDTP